MSASNDYNITARPSTVAASPAAYTSGGTTTAIGSIAIAEDPIGFSAMVMLVGIIGTLANGIVLYAMCVPKLPNKQTVSTLFVNQLLLDMYCGISMVLVYAIKTANRNSIPPNGYWFCLLINNDKLLWAGLHGSKLNLVNIAIERYVMIIHPVWHKNNFRPWMTRVAIGISWFVGGLASYLIGLAMTVVFEGQCYYAINLPTRTEQVLYAISYFACFFATVLLALLICYGRIVASLRRRMLAITVQHANNALATAKSVHNLRIEMNAVKTMITVSVAFVVCWLPLDLYTAVNVIADLTVPVVSVYSIIVFGAFFNVVFINPLIYATKYDVVSTYLRRFIDCRRITGGKSTAISVIAVLSQRNNRQSDA